MKRLFFPFATPFEILEFASYLSYIGVPMEEQIDKRTGTGASFWLATRSKKDGPCGYRVFVCHPGRHPEAGDLVIVFPDDVTTLGESTALSTGRPVVAFFLCSRSADSGLDETRL